MSRRRRGKAADGAEMVTCTWRTPHHANRQERDSMSAATIRYIFGMNAGRSGSHYLAGLLGTAAHVVSLHEPLPIMVGAPMQSFNEGDTAALEQLMPVKVQQIQQSASHGKTIYCETNPSYIKGW